MAERPASLPRGRHRLSREEVVAAQRERMMLAVAEAMAEKGYGATTVADVLARAGVSRETFYQQFSSKLDCFLQTFDAAAGLLVVVLGERIDRSGPPATRLERAVGTYLDTIAGEPTFARLFLVESYAAGPAAIERRAAVQARLADALADLLEERSPEGRFACRALVAAVGGLVTPPLVSGDVEAVRALHEPVLQLARRLLHPVR